MTEPGPLGLSFLDDIAGFLQAQIQPPNQPNLTYRPHKLATIDPDYDPDDFPGTSPRVTFDGESVISEKLYSVLGGYQPHPGDRVLMAPIGHTYVVAGTVDAAVMALFALQLRLTSTSDVSPSSTAHAFQIGPTSGQNLRMDANEIVSAVNGVAGNILMNPDGGNVQVNSNTSGGRVVHRTNTSDSRMHWGTYSGTTASDGRLTITHGAGFTPVVVICQPHTPVTGDHIAQGCNVDNIGATTFRARHWELQGSTNLDTIAVTGHYVCLD